MFDHLCAGFEGICGQRGNNFLRVNKMFFFLLIKLRIYLRYLFKLFSATGENWALWRTLFEAHFYFKHRKGSSAAFIWEADPIVRHLCLSLYATKTWILFLIGNMWQICMTSPSTIERPKNNNNQHLQMVQRNKDEQNNDDSSSRQSMGSNSNNLSINNGVGAGT